MGGAPMGDDPLGGGSIGDHPSRDYPRGDCPSSYQPKGRVEAKHERLTGDHHRVKRRFGIWLRPDRWAFVNFLNFILSSKPLAFSQKRPSHDGKPVALKRVCSKMVSTPPRAWMTSVR